MAEAVIKVVLDKLLTMTTANIMWMMGLRKELDNISSELDAIQHLLQDAETRQISNHSVRDWLQKLKYVGYDLDDLLEELRIIMKTEAGNSHASSTGFLDQVRNFSSSLMFLLRHPSYSYEYRAKVDEIKQRLDQIGKEKNRYQFVDNPVRKMREVRITTPSIDSIVIGRDEDKEILISKIIDEEGLICGDRDEVPIISILGIGGLGKTTLAKAIYNDDKVQNHFGGKCMWVCVGEVFDKEAILKTMIDKWGEKVDESLSKPEQVEKMLQNKRYFLVLDDVWNVDYLEWEPFQWVLNKGAKDSRVVITTRNTRVETTIPYELKGLNDDYCMSIFRNIVFKKNKHQEYEHLIDIGERIVEKCGGLPLAVKTIASVIRDREPTKEQWENVLKSKMWDLSESEIGILPALMLSYTDLTPQLKNYFSYCSIFEKDSILVKDELIKMWVSQGFIRADGERDEEELGEECFYQLLGRSMFQEPQRDENGNIISCKMHDLVHDLAQLVTKEECRVIGTEDPKNKTGFSLKNVRHCRVKVGWKRDTEVVGVEKLRTFIDYKSDKTPIQIIKSMKCVRVLDLRWPRFGNQLHLKSVPLHFGNQLHLRHLILHHMEAPGLAAGSFRKCKELRYLDMSHSRMTALPKSIVSLKNLRQLNLKECLFLTELPETLMSLGHLRVIDLTDCSSLSELPEGITALPGLRRLSVEGCVSLRKLPYGTGKQIADNLVVAIDRFIVASSAGRSSISELGRFNMVCPRGLLRVYKLEEVIGRVREEARSAKLEAKTSLKELSLSWGNDREVQNMMRRLQVEESIYWRDYGREVYKMMEGLKRVLDTDAQVVLKALHPPGQLTSLEICCYPGLEFPSWIGDAAVLGCLNELTLVNCCNCTQLPCLGMLPNLRTLRISGLQGVKRVGSEFFGGSPSAFPSLAYLCFSHMENWSEWEDCTTSILKPRLWELTILDCPKLEGVPPFIPRSFSDRVVIKKSPLLESLNFLFIHNTLSSCIHLFSIGQMQILPYLPISEEWLTISLDKEMQQFPSGLLRHTTMKKLKISGFRRMSHLPKELTQLKDLQLLIIDECPILTIGKRCQIGGELWPIIAHIPCVIVDGRIIQVVLEGLHPPRQLKMLDICCYPGLEFPSWIGDAAVFGCLKELTLVNCCNCTQLPCLGLLPSLQTLQIWGLQGVKRVGSEFLGGSPSAFPTLVELHFSHMENWSEWEDCSTNTTTAEERSELQPPTTAMIPLLVLTILDCPKLEGVPPFFLRSCLRVGVMESPLLESLHFLPIYDNNLSCIHLVRIDGTFRALMNSSTMSRPPGRWFRISLDEEMWQFPSGLLRHTAMKKLRISDFPRLGHLPKELTQLKDNLQLLFIEKCPLLSIGGRCQIGGELWPIIAHIPCVVVDGINIQGEFSE